MSDIDNVVLEKDAFENDTIAVDAMVPEPESIVENRGDLVEIGTHFDDLQLDEALVHIAKTNQLDISWEKLQRILDSLINKQCTTMEDTVKDEETKKAVDVISTRIIHSINEHSNCPFTIQRLCELMIEPKKYYKMYIKYLRAVDKVLSVTSYWEDYVNTAPKDYDEENKIEVPLLLPSFSVELEPHQFDTEDIKEDVMEDVTKDEQVVEPVVEQAKDIMEEDIKQEGDTTKGEEVVMEEDIKQEDITKGEEEAVMEEVAKEDVTKEEENATSTQDVAKEEEEKKSEPTKEEDTATTTTSPPPSNGKMDLD